MKPLEADSMSTAQSLSYLASSHHGSGTSLLSSHSRPRHTSLDPQWVAMPLTSLLLTASDLLQTSSFCSSCWEQCVTTRGELGKCWVTCFLCARATCLALLVWISCSVVLRIEPVISNMLGECSIAELYGPALYCVIWYCKPPYSLPGDPSIHSCFHRRAVTQALVPAHPSSCIRVEQKEGLMILA